MGAPRTLPSSISHSLTLLQIPHDWRMKLLFCLCVPVRAFSFIIDHTGWSLALLPVRACACLFIHYRSYWVVVGTRITCLCATDGLPIAQTRKKVCVQNGSCTVMIINIWATIVHMCVYVQVRLCVCLCEYMCVHAWVNVCVNDL
jgi:hypothetical protein